LEIRNPLAARLDLVATPTDLSGKNSTAATLVATLLDAWVTLSPVSLVTSCRDVTHK